MIFRHLSILDVVRFCAALTLTLGALSYVTNNLRFLAYPAFGLGIALLLALGMAKSTRRCRASFILLVLSFLFSSALASIIHESIALLFGAVYVAAIVIILLFENSSWRREFNQFIAAFHIANLAFITLSLIDSLPVPGQSYSGLFYNPNSMGGVLSVWASILLAQGLGLFLENKRYLGFTFSILSCILLIVLLSTRSRSGVGAYFAVAVLVICLFAIAQWKQGRRIEILTVIFSLVVAMIMFWDLINYGLIDKTLEKASRGDLTDGRLEVWLQVLADAAILGYGRLVFEGGIGAHNTYISLLAQYGLVSSFIFLVLLIVIAVKSLTHAQDASLGAYRYIPVASALSFILLSMFEGMMMKTAMFALFLFCVPLFRQGGRRRPALAGIG